ncbi:uncharacterized protein DSM5745_10251 [Aspergillus mulundensis]|uniref:Uncharacterized protein n=1 Tax=Aspergillus mulundensis TaxID=1810919 RepID=A0A3D8QNB6_9EURO|nr:Uncharacterized protein DSM5745_10251 [Aspergillus mulundensis]RDW63140.1 Uncharacterized protein DSM5745_10251 [Aspergillus mulundensis]
MNPFAQSQSQSLSQPPAEAEAPTETEAEAGPSTPSHTEDQKRHFYDSLPASEKQDKSYKQWVQEAYTTQYEKWMPWLEDQYLRLFGKGDNKASYVARENLSKTKLTGNSHLDQLQDDTNNLLANQVSENGLLAPVGNAVSKEGINRVERGGRDERGSYGGALGLGGVVDPVVDGVKSVGGSIGGVWGGAGGK